MKIGRNGIKPKTRGAKYTKICIYCRKSFKGNVSCGVHNNIPPIIAYNFRAPKRTNTKAWRLLEELFKTNPNTVIQKYIRLTRIRREPLP